MHHETILRLKRILLAYMCASAKSVLASLGLLHSPRCCLATMRLLRLLLLGFLRLPARAQT